MHHHIRRFCTLQADAACPPPESTAVFVGVQHIEYSGVLAAYAASLGAFAATGSPLSVAAGRLSFTYGFKGPSVRFLRTSMRACIVWHAPDMRVP